MRLSPPITVLTRSGTPRRRKIASAATGSVGATTAPNTKAAAHGRPMTKWAAIATRETVSSTRPIASSRIGRMCARRSRGDDEKAAELSSGGRKTRKITSGGREISGIPGTKPMARPPSTRKIGYGTPTFRASCASSTTAPSSTIKNSISADAPIT